VTRKEIEIHLTMIMGCCVVGGFGAVMMLIFLGAYFALWAGAIPAGFFGTIGYLVGIFALKLKLAEWGARLAKEYGE
jgi:hypothetical protein